MVSRRGIAISLGCARTVLATLPAILLASFVIWHGSNAAVTASTRNAGNNWNSGAVMLTDDDLGAAAFQMTDLVPGASGTNCIVVTSGADTPSVVKTYLQNLDKTQAKGLEKHIMFRLEEGKGGSSNDCTGFTPSGLAPAAASLETLATSMSDYASGGTPWTTTGTPGEKKSYRGSWTFDTAGMTQAEVDAMQGGSVSIDLVWELQNR